MMNGKVAFPLLVGWLIAGACHGQTLDDPGFESYSVVSGGFVKPTTGAWAFNNDAGVVEPFAPNSSNGPLDTWSATFAAPEGTQYASTYAGSDSIVQSVQFDVAGEYVISVLAAAPDGQLTIPGVATLDLLEAEFVFTLDGSQIGDVHALSPGSDWSSFTADFNLDSSGTFAIGVRNTKSAPYFINFDNFSIVPEPASGLLALFTFSLAAAFRRRRRKAAYSYAAIQR